VPAAAAASSHVMLAARPALVRSHSATHGYGSNGEGAPPVRRPFVPSEPAFGLAHNSYW
jgi:hypothetical protein